MLRFLDVQARNYASQIQLVQYITPERGGDLKYDGNVETNISNNPQWLINIRRQNQSENFRQVSVREFRRLENLVLKKIEKNVATRRDLTFSFDSTVQQINSLLDNVKIDRSDDLGFKIRTNDSLEFRDGGLSSGESELISLAIEILSFCYQAEHANDPNKINLLLLDEPDVHLHPDLQYRLMKLLVEAIRDKPVTVIIATHSTAILGGLSAFEDTAVGFMKARDNDVQFQPIADSIKRVLPIFGAHPLSNIFNEKPVLLVEGEDDERVWQQAFRSSQGQISFWPCAVDDIQSLNEYENTVDKIAGAVYENAKAYSLRDRDGLTYEIDDKQIVQRMRLACRAAENLILSDDVLQMLGTNWATMKTAMDKWLQDNPTHSQALEMRTFIEGHYDRRRSDLKALRNIMMALAGSYKPWEVAVGQAIANLVRTPTLNGEHCLAAYLGPKLANVLGLQIQFTPDFIKALEIQGA